MSIARNVSLPTPSFASTKSGPIHIHHGKPKRSNHSFDYSNLTQVSPDGYCRRCWPDKPPASYTKGTHSNGQCPYRGVTHSSDPRYAYDLHNSTGLSPLDNNGRAMSIESFDESTNTTTVYLDDTAPFKVPKNLLRPQGVRPITSTCDYSILQLSNLLMNGLVYDMQQYGDGFHTMPAEKLVFHNCLVSFIRYLESIPDSDPDSDSDSE